MCAAPASANQLIADQRSSILVVDDEPLICAMVQKTLSVDAVTVRTTMWASEALELLEREHFDLLLTDINMPEMNGMELAERARALQPWLGVVIMTAYGSFENMVRALRTGVADFIIKPFNIDDLRAAVARALERQQLQRDNVRLQTLVKVFEYSQAINSTLNLDALYAITGELVLRETKAAALAVWTVDAQGQLRAEHRVAASEALLATMQPVVEVAYQTRGVQTLRLQTDQSDDVAILLAAPLVVHGEPLGVLAAGYTDVQPLPSVELLAVIAYQVALAMRNARQYEALRELDRLKSEFIGIASHELRTPLSLVLGYSSLLRNRLEGRERETLQYVIDGALRIGDIIDDLVNLRRAERHQLDLDLMEFDLRELLDEVLAEMAPLAAERGISVQTEVPSTPLPIVADRARIESAIAQLIDNATKFTEAGGVVKVVVLRDPSPKQDIIIEVYDTGIGIAAHDIGRIFERFYQTAPSATRIHSGLGLGLTLAKVWIELHGGTISVQSQVGKGSVFRVRLPMRPPEANDAP